MTGNMFSVNKKQADKIRTTLLKNKQTIAVAESVTAGLLQFAFSTIPDASQFFQGGITAFNVAQKFKHLRVEPIHALQVNCVSQQVATEMAINSCELFSSHWGIGITGYATPVPESGKKIFAYYAIVQEGKLKAYGKLVPRQKNPPDVQEEYVLKILRRFADI
jgi:nicotinamide-nucleotide amidase